MLFLRVIRLIWHFRRIHIATAILIPGLTPVLSQAVQSGSPVIGDWKFIAILDSVDITAIDEKGAQRLLGKIMTIRKDGARFDNYKCHTTDFDTERVEPNLYLQKEGGIDNSKLRLPKPVTVVDISCATVFVKNRNRVVITWDGWFFEATRVNR